MTDFVLMGEDVPSEGAWDFDWLFDADAHASCTHECMREAVFVVREEDRTEAA